MVVLQITNFKTPGTCSESSMLAMVRRGGGFTWLDNEYGLAVIV